MIKNSKLFSFLLILPLFILILGGCGKSASEIAGEKAAEKNIENQTGGQANVDINNGSIKIEGSLGKIESGDNVKLPAYFPDDVYVIEGKIITAFSNQADKSITLSIDSTASIKEAFTIYQEKLKATGWLITGIMNYGDSANVIAEKDKRTASIFMNKSGDKISVVLVIAEK
ncbi:MAG: hypothetical protein WC745_01175 [Patescibacteria group bacterium]|jgi:predicted transcriptional regulator